MALPMHDSLAIELADVRVHYRIASERINSLKETVVRQLQGRRLTYRDLWALNGVSTRIHYGESVGLIGANGAGKSTLLKTVARVLFPSSGRVWIRGAVAPLIELGAGFNSELTGRENILLNGAMLGFSRRQILERMDRIVAFAELEDFIAAPLRTYSSGMQARLAFSIATDVDPDILLVDEVLSVGDMAFQARCYERMAQFRDRGTVIVLVSHDLDAVQRLCTRVVWIHHGQIAADGEPARVIEQYRRTMDGAHG